MFDLIEAVRLRKQIETQIKTISDPLKAQIKTALDKLPDLLKSAKGIESERRERAEREYAEAHKKRRQRLLAGEDAPQIVLPAGVTVSWVDEIKGELRYDDLGSLFSRGFLIVDEAKIKKSLQAGTDVPGFALVKRPSLRVVV